MGETPEEKAESRRYRIAELKAVFALGVMAGMLALVQYWNANRNQSGSLLGLSYPSDCLGNALIPWQSNLFIIILVVFASYAIAMVFSLSLGRFKGASNFLWKAGDGAFF